MNFRSIRFRLTAWYVFSAAVILSLFAWSAWIAMRDSVLAAIDHDLRIRIENVRAFTASQSNIGPAQLTDEFQEQALLGLGGGFLRVSDGNGHVLFRSPGLKGARFDAWTPNAGGDQAEFGTRRAGGLDIRVASQSIHANGRLFRIDVAEPMHEFDESIERFGGILLILAPIALLLAGLGGFWISTRALAPVDRITRDARQISVANLSSRLRTPGTEDELQRLTQTLNEMLDRIDLEVKRIVQFTADASHELRAPLTLIHTAAEFSLRRERTRAELLEALGKIVRESARTSRLVDELLLLARADSGTDEMRVASLDLRSAVRDAAEQASTLAEPKNIAVSTDIPGAPVLVDGDERLLARLLLILLDNAVKYTNPGGRVAIGLSANGPNAQIGVDDTGIGIAPADLPYIYDRFWRADQVRSRNSGGAGLGLSIARWIVRRHGGEIEITSEPERGTRVTVRLPLRSGAAAMAL